MCIKYLTKWGKVARMGAEWGEVGDSGPPLL
jgi:hypothetical protein